VCFGKAERSFVDKSELFQTMIAAAFALCANDLVKLTPAALPFWQKLSRLSISLLIDMH